MDSSERYLTPPQIAKRFGVATAKVIGWIRTGELKALNLANRDCTRPRYAVSPDALAEFELSRMVVPPTPKPRRNRTLYTGKDYFAHIK